MSRLPQLLIMRKDAQVLFRKRQLLWSSTVLTQAFFSGKTSNFKNGDSLKTSEIGMAK